MRYRVTCHGKDVGQKFTVEAAARLADRTADRCDNAPIVIQEKNTNGYWQTLEPQPILPGIDSTIVERPF